MDKGPIRVAGALATGVALTLLWILSGVTPLVAFPPTALAGVIVRATPGGFATFFIELLQHWALRGLAVGVVIGTLAIGAQILVWTRDGDRLRAELAGGILAAISVAVTLIAPGDSNPVAVVPASVAAAGVYAVAARAVHARLAAPPHQDLSRRRALGLGVGGAMGLIVGGGIIGWIARRLSGPDRDVDLVEPAQPATIPSRQEFPDVAGISPEVTSPEDHYVVDINLVSPSVEADGWTLRVFGEVERELSLTFDELQRQFEVVEDYSVLTCISNEVGGPLVGHSAWGGVRLADVLEEAGVGQGAIDVVFRAADGYTDSIPIEAASDPAVILAVSQDGEPLTQEHGFPCRVRIPAIYGMKNVKWVREIEVVRRDYRGYWMQRGWSDVAVVRTQSRIDVAGDDGAARVGEPTWVAGVAWAGRRGVSKVEVSVDGAKTWRTAELKEPINDGVSWRLWAYRWTPERKGRVAVFCRATDGAGEVQTAATASPHPAGATGHHTVDVSVS